MTKSDFLKNSEEKLTALYGADKTEYAKTRYGAAIDSFIALYGDGDFDVFSVPGRTEISGNHTDHNHGEVLAASVDLDIIAVVRRRDDLTVNVKSEGFAPDCVDISDLAVHAGEKNTSSALIRGVADGFVKNGYAVCGFDAYTTSDVMGGSGLSSSAAFEDMIGTIFNHYCNGSEIDFLRLSQISQYAENAHFGKPCGLMDQVACAAGGFVYIDFADTSAPVCRRIPFDIEKHGYKLCIVATGGSHADLTDDYASVPAEMKAVASYFGKEYLRGLTTDDIAANADALRKKFGDRACVRALHFINENARVEKVAAALDAGDMAGFMALIRESGVSSAMYLQNYYSTKAPAEQGITLGCGIAASLLGTDGAYRVHGGGFAGTIQAFVPVDKLDLFISRMEIAFGKGSVTVLNIRADGAIKIG
ncbi:MAG: galactokinase [Clostridia bacterium]|nr:galactokinase [Clostridia bacterium]